MNEIEVKRRGWAKNAAIVFLIIMIILSLLSNTIMNRSLPEVAAQYTQSSTITSRIRDSGTVVANELYEVVVSQAFTVSEVPARLGDTVEPGDVLVRLSKDGSAELEATEEELRRAELDLEKLLLNAPDSSSTYAGIYRQIQSAKNALTLAEEERKQARDDRKNAQSAVKTAEAERDAIGFDAAAYRTWETQINAAAIARESSATEVEAARAVLNTFLEINGESSVLFGLPDETILNPSLVIDAQYIMRRDALKNAMDAQATAHASWAALVTNPTYTALLSAKEKWDIADKAVSDAKKDLEIADSALVIAESAVTSAQLQLDAANDSLAEAQKTGGKDNSLFGIDVREKNREIDELREKIEELQEEGSITEITAPVGGKITQVNISSGHQTVPDSPLMIIEVADMGYTLTIPVTNDQSTRVNIGEVAEVDRGWFGWGSPMTAVLTGIRPDPQRPGQGRLLVFSVSGEDIESGTQLNITIAQRSENYGIVVPNSAIRTDTNGDFVLIVESRNTPLRNRYIATRVDVNILASDDVNSAISGAGLGGWDFVITTSTRPIEPGMQVRLVDNP